MEARFIGDPRYGGEGPAIIRLFGAKFPKGKWVTGLPETHRAKMEGHNHFQVRDDGATVEPAMPGPAADDEQPLTGNFGATARDPLDHDGDGHKGGSKSKADCIEALDAIKARHPEFDYDARLGAPKLNAALEEAQFKYGDDD